MTVPPRGRPVAGPPCGAPGDLPPLPRTVVGLPRVRHVLDAAAVRPAVLVTGPAGYGKSTALAQWAAALCGAGRTVSWVTAESRHAEPGRFWSAVVAAVGADAVPQPRGAPADPVVAVLERLAGAPQVLVVDDYDEVDAAVGSDVVRLVEALPEGAHVVLAARRTPGLPRNRWRLEGRLSELCGGDLELRPDEVRAVAERSGLAVGPGELEQLGRRVDGWVAGVRLAALQRARGPAADAVLGDRFAWDYLAGEVLDGQPPPMREFLLLTSVLDRLTPASCAAVVGRGDARPALERAERDNLFVIPTDGPGPALRYHRQFRALLRSRLADQPDRERAAHRAAAQWCAEHDEPEAAVEHALAAGAADLAGRLVDETGAAVLRRGHVGRVTAWLDRLPPESWAERPTLLLRRALAAAERSEVSVAAEALADAERLGLPVGDQELRDQPVAVRADVLALRAFLAAAGPDPDRAGDPTRRALAALVGADPAARAAVLLALGRGHLLADDLPAAGRAFLEAVAVARAGGDGPSVVVAGGELGRVHAAAGRLHDGAALLRGALADGAELPGGGPDARAGLHAALADVGYEWDQLDDAGSHAHRAVELARRDGLPHAELAATATSALVRQAQGDPDGADAALGRACAMAVRHDTPWRTAALLDAHRLRLLVARGDRAGVARWRASVAPRLQRLDPVTRARLHVALDEPDAALDLLARPIARGRAQGTPTAVAAALVVRAVALLRRGDEVAAVDVLASALLEVEAEGHVRTFLDAGPAVLGLLRRVHAERGRAAGPAGRLVSAWIGPGAADRLLTGREREVLQLLDEGLSNRDIGRRLSLSEGTVRTHLYRAYAKLGVRSRLEAVAAARSRGLLIPAGR